MNAPSVIQFPRTNFLCQLAQLGIPTSFWSAFDQDGQDNVEAYISGSAVSTLHGFETDIRRWFAHCSVAGANPLKPHARDVRDFIRIFEAGRRPSTIKRMVANIGVLVASILGGKNVTKTKIVWAEMKRIRREQGSQGKQALAIRQLGDVAYMTDPALPFSIERMIAALESDPSFRSARGKLILSLGGDTGRRNSEYRNADMRHLILLPSGEGALRVDRSKTDQDGNGIVRFASRRTMRLLEEWKRWRTEAGEDVGADSPLYVAIDKGGTPRGRLTMSGYHIVLRATVKKALKILAVDEPDLLPMIPEIVRRVSGHSFRVGMVEDLVTAGESFPSICVEGGWGTSAMPMLYARNLNAKNGAAARLRRKLDERDQ